LVGLSASSSLWKLELGTNLGALFSPFFSHLSNPTLNLYADLVALSSTLPPSFDYWNENEFLARFYSRKYKMKLRSGKEPHPSRVLYIGPNKRLNDYYAPRV
jgi:hypothetical protein